MHDSLQLKRLVTIACIKREDALLTKRHLMDAILLRAFVVYRGYY